MSELKGYDDWKLQTPPEYSEDPDDEPSDFTCCECGEELGEYGGCLNEECAEYDSEEEEEEDEGP